MRCIVKKATLSVNPSQLSAVGITPKKFSMYFPSYLRQATTLECGRIKYLWLMFIQLLVKLSIVVFLRPRKGQVGNLQIDEVEKVYNREAATYDWKHHLTTHGMDTTWRRLASWCAATFGRKNGSVAVLDLCTGTGLTIKEMSPLLHHWGIDARIIGLDYNARMLGVANSRRFDRDGVAVSFVRGDAMKLASNGTTSSTEMAQFEPNQFDVVTQMFGIGGISDPVAVFGGVLQIMKPGGQFFLMDMHQPIADQPGEWPLLLKWFRFPQLEAMTYNKTTMPVALNRLWGWRDTTLDFYLLPLITWQDANGDKWGFEIISFEVESQRWWLGLPIMPVGKIIVEKVKISDEQFIERRKVLSFV